MVTALAVILASTAVYSATRLVVARRRRRHERLIGIPRTRGPRRVVIPYSPAPEGDVPHIPGSRS